MSGVSRVLTGAVFGVAIMYRAALAQGGGEGWAARVEAGASGPDRLVVTGTVSTPNPGYKVELVKEGTEGSQLVLRIDMKPSSGVWVQMIQDRPVRYEEVPYSGDYSGVVIRSGTGDDRELEIAAAD